MTEKFAYPVKENDESVESSGVLLRDTQNFNCGEIFNRRYSITKCKCGETLFWESDDVCNAECSRCIDTRYGAMDLTDTQRMEWFDAHVIEVQWIQRKLAIYLLGGDQYYGANLREAIDNAIRERSKLA